MKKKVVLNEKMTEFVKNKKFLIKSYDAFAVSQTGKHVCRQPDSDKKLIQELYAIYIAEQLGVEVKDFEEAVKARALVYRQWDYEHNGDKRRAYVRNTSRKKKKSEGREEILNKQASIIQMDCTKPGFSQSYFDKFIVPAAKNKSRREEQEQTMKILVSTERIMSRYEFFNMISPDVAYSNMTPGESSWIESLYIKYINIKYDTKCTNISEADKVFNIHDQKLDTTSVNRNTNNNGNINVNSFFVGNTTTDSISNTNSVVPKRRVVGRPGKQQPEIIATDKDYTRTGNANKLAKLIYEWFELYIDTKEMMSIPVMTLPQFTDRYKSIILSMWGLHKDSFDSNIMEYLYKRYLNMYRYNKGKFYK